MSYKYVFLLIFFVSVTVSFLFLPKEKEKFPEDYIAHAFDLPLGKPDGEGYYNAQKFGENNHLGEDWNGIGGGNSDYGDSIFSIGNGQVVFAEDLKGGWGNVIRIKHQYKGEFYESLYAHCSSIQVEKGDWIKKGDWIGNLGDCNGKYLAHLHLEIRDSLEMPIGGGYSQDKKGYLNPTKFIRDN